MPEKDRFNEAPVHFELYRFLKNNLDKCYSTSIRYESVIPEFIIKNKAVDLVIDAEIGDIIMHFVAIEVKKPTMRSFLLFQQESVQQIGNYTKNLDPVFSILTDGYILRLFNKDNDLGNYRFKLNDDSIKQLLKELIEIYDGKRQTLSFPSTPSLNEEMISKERDGLVRALIEVLECLDKEEGFQLERRETATNHLRYLRVGSFKKVFRIGIEIKKRDISKDQSYVHLHLADLRDKLGVETLRELLEKLSRISVFNWVNPNVAKRKEKFTWKPVKYMTFNGKQDFNSFKKQLTEWFFKLSERLN